MMNRFNFRAWSGGKWWYSDDEAYVLKMYDGELWLCEDDGYYRQRSGEYRYSKIGKAIQSTGLTDRNEVEIFEGDVVKYAQESILSDKCTMIGPSVVMWDDSTFMFRLEAFSDFGLIFKAYEIIGNIYENSHLMETT